MIVNSKRLGEIASILSVGTVEGILKVDQMWVVNKSSSLVVIYDDGFLIDQNLEFGKELVNVFDLLGEEEVDYEVLLKGGSLLIRGENKEIRLACKTVPVPTDVFVLMKEESREVMVDAKKILEMKKFTSGQLIDFFSFVWLMSDGIYAGVPSFVARIKMETGCDGIGVLAKELSVLEKASDLSVRFLPGRGMIRVDGTIGEFPVSVFCRTMSSQKNVFRQVFEERREEKAVLVASNERVKEVVSQIVDVVRDDIWLIPEGNIVKYLIEKDNIRWEDVFGVIQRGNWDRIRVEAFDFVSIIEKMEELIYCSDKLVVIGDGGDFEAISAIVGGG